MGNGLKGHGPREPVTFLPRDRRLPGPEPELSLFTLRHGLRDHAWPASLLRPSPARRSSIDGHTVPSRWPRRGVWHRLAVRARTSAMFSPAYLHMRTAPDAFASIGIGPFGSGRCSRLGALQPPSGRLDDLSTPDRSHIG